MKYSIILIACAFIFFSCNENASKTGEDTDTTTTRTQTDTSSQLTSQPPTSSSNELMNPMSSMMQDMKSMQKTGDPDHDFTMMMVRHHKGAIDMSNVELTKGTDTTLKQMARKIIDDSQKENKELENFLSSHTGKKKSDYSDKAMAIMDRSMSSHSMSGNIDADFASMMIQHHKDGIEMAKEYLKTGTASKPKEIANKIIANQPRDIKKLEDWLTNHK